MTTSLLFPFIEGSTVIGGFESHPSAIRHQPSDILSLLFPFIEGSTVVGGFESHPSDFRLLTSI